MAAGKWVICGIYKVVSGWNLISSSGPISTPYSSLFLFLHLQSLDKGSAFTHQSSHPPILSWAAKVPCSPVSHSHWSRSMANADMFMAHHEALQREFMAHYEYIKRNSGLLKIIPCLGWATPLFGRNWKLSRLLPFNALQPAWTKSISAANEICKRCRQLGPLENGPRKSKDNKRNYFNSCLP